MEKREIRLKDGRYMVFYTFEDEPPESVPPLPRDTDEAHARADVRGGKAPVKRDE